MKKTILAAIACCSILALLPFVTVGHADCGAASSADIQTTCPSCSIQSVNPTTITPFCVSATDTHCENQTLSPSVFVTLTIDSGDCSTGSCVMTSQKVIPNVEFESHNITVDGCEG